MQQRKMTGKVSLSLLLWPASMHRKWCLALLHAVCIHRPRVHLACALSCPSCALHGTQMQLEVRGC